MGVTIGRMSVTGVWRQTGRMGVTNGRMGVTIVWGRLCKTILALRASLHAHKRRSAPTTRTVVGDSIGERAACA